MSFPTIAYSFSRSQPFRKIRVVEPPKAPKEEESEDADSLEIKPLETDKSKIKQNKLQQSDVIPRHPSSVIFNGSSGSGKSTLLANLLTKPQFYGKYFKKSNIYLISPTGDSDDIFAHLKLPQDNICVDLRDTKFLEDILEKQKEKIEQDGVHKAEKVLVIYEDVQSNARFMRSKAFLRSFLMNRHFGLSTWLCGQSYKLTPRACRLQSNNVFIFQPSNSEKEIIIEDFCPPGMNKKEFEKIVDHATEQDYSFLHVNRRVPFRERYRKNLGHILSIGGEEELPSKDKIE